MTAGIYRHCADGATGRAARRRGRRRPDARAPGGIHPGEAVLLGEPVRPRCCQQQRAIGRAAALGDLSRHADRVGRPSRRGKGTGSPARAIHDAGIELEGPVHSGHGPAPGVEAAAVLEGRHRLDDGVQHRARRLEHLPAGLEGCGEALLVA